MANNFSVAIVGCGSVGSRLAMRLAEIGVERLLLMDNEMLLPQNAVRHLCGLSEAIKNTKKVNAVKRVLDDQFPKIECLIYGVDVLEYLHKGNCDFNGFDILVSCVGDLSVERRLDFAAKNKIIKCPIMYLWLEPYAIAAHALYIPSLKAGTYKEFFNDKGEFIHSVLKNGFDFSKREAGCQSSFMPYSSDDSQNFIIDASNLIVDLYNKNERVLYSWLGDLKRAYRLGYSINDSYMDNMPFTSIKRIS